MNIEELKKIVRGNGFQESHGSTTIVIDVETVVDLLDELKQCDIPVVSRSFSDWLKEVTEIDSKQKFLLEYTELIEWEEWYQKGLTPNEAVKLNCHNYG